MVSEHNHSFLKAIVGPSMGSTPLFKLAYGSTMVLDNPICLP